MTFPFNAYLLAIVGACGTALVTLPLWRKWCLRIGLVDDPGQRKIHDQPIPLAGGLAVIAGILLPTIAASLAVWCQGAGAELFLRHGLERRAMELARILLGAVGILAVGWLDDKHELSPVAKFCGQMLIAALVAASVVRITLFVHSVVFSYAITILWMLTVINAFNFMDNMNGLCAGLGAIGAWYFAVIAAADGQYLVALIAFLTFGALLGFFSHLVGYLLAVLAILPHFYTPRHPRRWAVLIPLAVLAVPLLDLAWVVVLRWRMGRPFYLGDTNHLSHRLVRLGLTQTRAVLLIWLLAALAAALACLA